jgi:thymidylate synthase
LLEGVGTCSRAKSSEGVCLTLRVKSGMNDEATISSPVANGNETERNHEEEQYLDLVRRIVRKGETRRDRTGTGTRQIFGPPQMRYDLSMSKFPLLTTKRVFTKAIIHELLWFISGCTDGEILSKKGVKIWEGNGSNEYLSKLGLGHRRQGDLGPVYGFQWRHFGAAYVDCDTDYTGQGVDQLARVIEQIKTNPYDRRIIMSAWNPSDLSLMALPPCHLMCHFSVSTATTPHRLSCLLYQRSADMGLGVPFNIASYALLTHMIAHVCQMEAGDFIHIIGDAHVYLDHIAALETQISRTPRPFPTLNIKRAVADIDDFEYEDFEIVDYNPHPKIEMAMSV